MSMEANEHRLKAGADGILELVREMIQDLRQVLEKDDWKTKEAQLQAISKTVESLEAVEVTVPEDLRKMKTDLASELAGRDEAERQFEALISGLAAMVSDMQSLGVGRSAGTNSGGSSPTSQRVRRPSGPRLEDACIGEALVEALRHLGGSAHCREVLSKMGKMLEGRLTPRDEQPMKDGRPAWHNKAYKERERLISEAVLKDNSRMGYWELREEKP